MAQTAVEWLLKQINKQSYSLGDINITINVPKDIIEQAKQMEKEQLNIARLDGIQLANKGYGK